MNSKEGSTVILEWLAIEGRGKGVGNREGEKVWGMEIKRKLKKKKTQEKGLAQTSDDKML